MRFDKWTYIIGAVAIGTAAALGVLAAGWPGLLAAFAGLIPAILWQTATERHKSDGNRAKLLDVAARRLIPHEIPEGPTTYLRPEAKIVRFWPRPELAKLHAWATTSLHADIQLVIGEGGTGKTRLALQLSQELAEESQWRAYWVSPGEETNAAVAANESRIPVLLILDYAETRNNIGKFLAQVIRNEAKANVRVLLLARSVGEWWQQLIASTVAVLSETLTSVQPIALGPLTDPSGQREVFQLARQAFAAELNTSYPETAQLPSLDPCAPALVVHAAALLMVLDHRTGQVTGTGPHANDVIAGLLRHEARYWQQTQVPYGLDLGPVVSRRVVAVGTLVGADDEESAVRVLSALDDLADPAVRGRAARWLHDLYPPDAATAVASEWIAPLRPDLVAENLVVGVLNDHPQLTLAVLGGLDEQRAVRTLTLLARTALSDPVASNLILHALTSDFPHLAVPALAVAIETNPHIGEQLADIFESRQWPLDLVNRIAQVLPEASVALARVAAAIFQHLADATTDDSRKRSSNLISLSNRLADLGRREDALAAIDEAVSAYRQLAATRPDTFLPNLAVSLNNQSNRLSQLGRREDALAAADEAVSAYRQLAATRPDTFLPNLAASLNNQSNRLSQLGRREDALAAADEAASAYRQLATTRPDAYLPNLALALNNQSVCLADLGRHEDALAAADEAVSAYRQLAATLPDAFLPDLAGSLSNQSGCLAMLGRHEDALAVGVEAVSAYRQLAATRPDAYLPYLALALNNQTGSLAQLGRHQDALAAADEAVSTYRQLAATRPDAYLPYLALALSNQSSSLAHLRRHQDALATIDEAVSTYRQLAATLPDAYLSDLALALYEQSNRLTRLGRYEDALAAADDAVSAYRQLAATRPDAFLSNLAASLHNQSGRLAQLGRREDALAAMEEAVTIRRPLAASRPHLYAARLASSLRILARLLRSLGKDSQADEMEAEAARLTVTSP